jgi:CheY-like chemotaxis protein
MTLCILVVEDNKDNMKLIDSLLRAYGYSPLLAGGGSEGAEIAVGRCPDLVLLDIRMRGMDGYEVAALLRREPRLEGTRIVALTASAMVGDREKVVAAGFDGYIQKPIDPETFLDQIKDFFPCGIARARRGERHRVTSVLVLDDQTTDRELPSTELRRVQRIGGFDRRLGARLARTQAPDLIIADILIHHGRLRIRADTPVVFCTRPARQRRFAGSRP